MTQAELSTFNSDDPIVGELAPGERVLWRQRAQPGPLARSRLPAVFFMLVWAGFAWSWTSIVVFGMGSLLFAQGLTLPVLLFPLVFLSVGALFSWIGATHLWSRIRDLRSAWATHYAVTSQRIIVAAPDWVTSVEGASLASLARGLASKGGTLTVHSSHGALDLIGVDDPARVEALIRTTFAPARAAIDP